MEPLKRCNIDIQVRKSSDGKEGVFTSGSVISGTVIITARRATAVAAISVSLVGITTIALDSMGDFHSSRHQFLTLKMPPLDHHLPRSRILPAGTAREIPFDFTVPHRLSISACIHSKHQPLRWDAIERHTLPPPSSGDWDSQDKIPGRTGIAYLIRAEVVRKLHPDSQDTLTERAERPVRVLPAFLEDPRPFDLDLSAASPSPCLDDAALAGSVTNTDGSCSRSAAKVRGSLMLGFRRKALGSITASVKQQPRPVRLTSDGGGALGSCVQVQFEFLPFGPQVPPPKIRVKSCKMISTTAYTWIASTPTPEGSRHEHRTYTHHAAHPVTYLAPDCAGWTRLDLRQGNKGGDSASCLGPSVCSGPANSITEDGFRFRLHHPRRSAAAAAMYKTLLKIPFTLLKKGPGFHVPTFDSCLISRAYTLQLTFTAGATKPSISLTVPIQVRVQPNNEPDATEPAPPSFSSVMASDQEQRGHGNETENENAGPNAVLLHYVSMAEMQCSSLLPPEYDSGIAV